MEYLIGTMVLAMMAFVVTCFVWVGRALSKSTVTKHFETYKHHSEKFVVWVRSDLKGRHRDHCLCFDCKKFHPGTNGNCPLANILYNLCVTNNIVTPVWECPTFAQDPFAADRIQ